MAVVDVVRDDERKLWKGSCVDVMAKRVEVLGFGDDVRAKRRSLLDVRKVQKSQVPTHVSVSDFINGVAGTGVAFRVDLPCFLRRRQNVAEVLSGKGRRRFAIADDARRVSADECYVV